MAETVICFPSRCSLEQRSAELPDRGYQESGSDTKRDRQGSALQQSVSRLTRRDGEACSDDCQTSHHGYDVGYGWGHVASGTPVDAMIVIQIRALPKSNQAAKG